MNIVGQSCDYADFLKLPIGKLRRNYVITLR